MKLFIFIINQTILYYYKHKQISVFQQLASNKPSNQYKIMQKQKSSSTSQVTLSCFFRITVMMCLVNLIVMSRLHMFDEITIIAQQYFDEFAKSADHNKNKVVAGNMITVLSAPKISSINDFLSLFSLVKYENTYLLPLVMEFSAICLVVFTKFIKLERIYRNSLIIIIINFVCFTLLWIKAGNSFIYRLTYMIQGILFLPSLIITAFGLVRLIPKHILNFKAYYAVLMYMLPFIGISISYYLFDIKTYEMSARQLLQNSYKKIMYAGVVISSIAFVVLLQSRSSILYTLEYRLNSAIQKFSSHPESQQLDRNFTKQKLQNTISSTSNQYIRTENNRIFDQKSSSGSRNKKQQHIKISKQNLGTLLISWSAVIAVSKQLPYVKKDIYLSFNQPLIKSSVDQILQNSTKNQQLFIISASIVIALTMIALIRRKKVKSLQMTIISIATGYSALIVLFVALNGIIRPTVFLIQLCQKISRIFFLTFLLPAIAFVQETGNSLFETIPILFLMSWAMEIIIRIFLVSFENQTKIFIYAMLAVVSCYFVQKIGKQSVNENTQNASIEYGKIGEQVGQLQEELGYDNYNGRKVKKDNKKYGKMMMQAKQQQDQDNKVMSLIKQIQQQLDQKNVPK